MKSLVISGTEELNVEELAYTKGIFGEVRIYQFIHEVWEEPSTKWLIKHQLFCDDRPGFKFIDIPKNGLSDTGKPRAAVAGRIITEFLDKRINIMMVNSHKTHGTLFAAGDLHHEEFYKMFAYVKTDSFKDIHTTDVRQIGMHLPIENKKDDNYYW